MKIKEVYFRFLKLFDKHINLIVINLYLYIYCGIEMKKDKIENSIIAFYYFFTYIIIYLNQENLLVYTLKTDKKEWRDRQ